MLQTGLESKDINRIYLLLPTMERKLECKGCKHIWNYKGQSKHYATCPRCLNKVKVDAIKEDVETTNAG